MSFEPMRFCGWILPHRIYMRISDALRRRKEMARFERDFGPLQRLAGPNTSLRNKHKGARAFILCSGPTTLQQNLLPLKDELVFSVSTSYLHPQYDQIYPRYHCIPQITYSANVTETEVIKLFQEMHLRTGHAELFLSATEEKLVREHNLFPGRTIHYVFLHESFDELQSRAILDIASAVPAVQSVPLMCMMIAMYMGFEDIYLLGTEHSDFRTGEYRYAFEPTVLKNKDLTVGPGGKTLTSRYDDFHSFARLWRQYRVTGEIAKANGVRLWNATAGGELDEYPRVELDAVIAGESLAIDGVSTNGSRDTA